VWNIVLSTCLGLIAQEDVLEAHILDHAPAPAPPLTPRGALELVKERIEGEAVVPAWCTVDTKIGALGIHMEQGRCFDAEIHLDELGDRIRGAFREDQRGASACLIDSLLNLQSDRSRTCCPQSRSANCS
jgi:WD repeat-containing protein 48